MKRAIDFARNGQFDSFIAVGGGSVMDTANAAALYASNPQADFLDFIVPPFGLAKIPDRPMLPLIAIPTTAGTGSETTGVSIMDMPEHKCKTGIRLRCLKPLLAIVDPLNVMSLPRNVAVYSGFDVLCHALESYTALPYNERVPRPATPQERPVYQGSNPISDMWSLEALRVMQKYFRRSVFDPSDEEARTHMLMASSFAGVGIGNAGVHLCHGLSYPISSQNKKYTDPDYPQQKALIPHGLSVVTTAVADFEFLIPACPDRHANAAKALGADIPVRVSASNEYISRHLCDQIRGFMSDFKVPNGLGALGFTPSDLPNLTDAAVSSFEKASIAPRKTDRDAVAVIYEKSMKIY
ncbi:hypothetical protein PENTCL1PPCAC_747 [Pristionchus entomophagus]|uniref:hydroxyacid-oxoacid transhydrogenase n=1 Tax=Pristionchus entomophagus TaxID=358040 RepID=A0AAV5S8Q7_9BILA|nr:hypothetical protein PENTCL1PPCAC_747 [Pristionchus entomophagus]